MVSFGAGSGTRTHTPSLATDFESASSTNSNTPAYLRNAFLGCQLKVDSMCKVAVSVPMVGIVGLEPTHLAAPEPKSGASANFATSPYGVRNGT